MNHGVAIVAANNRTTLKGSLTMISEKQDNSMPRGRGVGSEMAIHRAIPIVHPVAGRRPEAEPPAAPQLCQMAGAECMAAPAPVRVQLKDWRDRGVLGGSMACIQPRP